MFLCCMIVQGLSARAGPRLLGLFSLCSVDVPRNSKPDIFQSHKPLEHWRSVSQRSPQHLHSDSSFGELQLVGSHRFGSALTLAYPFALSINISEPFELLALSELSS